MKSYFSRFLHHTLSHSGLTGVSRSNKSATMFGYLRTHEMNSESALKPVVKKTLHNFI